MTDLIVREDNLPATLEDLSKFVLIGRDKLQAVRAEINALQKLNVAEEVLAQKKAEQADIGAVVFPTGRIVCKTPVGETGNSPLQGSALIYCGENPQRFLKIFKPRGWGVCL